MGLSAELISQFVKVTKNDDNSKNESTAYGTVVKHNGSIYVKLDGSELLTPVNTTSDVEDNERVMVTIKNHTATVTGNMSSPSARTDTVKDIDKKVESNSSQISEFEIIVADKVNTGELIAVKADIDSLKAEDVTINGKLVAAEGDISKLGADTVTITGKLTVAEGDITNLKANNVTITGRLDATEGDISSLKAKDITVDGRLSAAEANIIDLEAVDVTITGKLTAAEGDITNLKADNVTITGRLDAAAADISQIETDMLTAGSAVIKNLQSDVADIDSLIFGSASGTTIQTSFANAVIAQLGSAQIKSAMIESVSASKVTAGDIITNNVRVKSQDGSLIISDETLQISDSTRVRVQIGKDASNDYSINIWDASGNLMFSKGGITDSAIKSAIIRNDMVSETANISASKLNIDSLFEEINGSSKTIKSSKVYFDDKAQTLDIAFGSMSTTVDGIRGNVESQGTQISVIQGQISSKIWQTDIDSTIDRLHIGGRNILRQSGKWKKLPTTWHSNGGGIELDTNVKYLGENTIKTTLGNGIVYDNFRYFEIDPSKTYTYSALVMSDTDYTGNGTVPLHYHCSHDGVSNTAGITVIDYDQKVIANEWKLIYLTFKPNGKYFRPFVYVGTSKSMTFNIAYLKLEEGSKPTDWTPAPEDVEGSLTTLSNQFSDISQEIDNISLTVGSHTTELTNKADSSEVTAMNSKLAELVVNLDGFKSTVSNTYATKTALADTNSKLPWVTNGWIDASSYDETLWIPFAGTMLPMRAYGRIRVTAELNTGTVPSWSTHSAGFSVEFEVESKRNGWGTSVRDEIIHKDTFTHCTVSPVSYKQLGYGSVPILYLRGGGKYYVSTNWECTWTGYPNGYAWTSGEYSQSANTSTTRPSPEGYMYGTKSEIKQLSDRITATVTDVNSLGTRISTVEQTASGLSVRLTDTETAAQNAAKTATNYLNFSNEGLMVGDMTASKLGNNVLIDTNSVDIRNGATTLASYQADAIYLGMNSPQTVIDLCSGTAQMYNRNTTGDREWYRLGLTSRDEIGFESSGQIAMDTYYETASGESVSGVFRLASSNPWVDELGVFPLGYVAINHRVSNDVSMSSQFSFGDEYLILAQDYMGMDISKTTSIEVIATATDSSINMKADSVRMTTNNSKIFGTDPNGVKKAVFIPQNQYGNTIVGYDNYTTGKGNTNLYGQDINFSSSEAGNVTYRPYYRGNGLESSGDTITMKVRTAGFVTSSGTAVQFTVPLSKPIIGNPTVTATTVDGFQLRGNGFYTHGSSASAYAKPSKYSVNTTNGGNNVVITATFDDITNITTGTTAMNALRNNSAIGIYWSGKLTITFG